MTQQEYRIEKDSMGELQVPAEAYMVLKLSVQLITSQSVV